MAFRAGYNYYTGADPILKGPYTVATGETITEGMACMHDSGEVKTLTTGSTSAGWAAADAAAGEEVYLYDVTTVMQVVDANARIDGAALDIATGAQGVTTKNNDDLVVVRTSSATEDTLVMLHPTKQLYYNAT